MADEQKQATEAADQSAQQPQAEQTTELTINDLNAVKVIIDIASSRGAFKPNEMVGVGQTYNKLVAFLEAVQKQADTQKAQQGA